ncbi:hypothetical protein CJP74_00725 [Psittacicella melopsittaci]|uniref:Uncharacterized protein n=1 Tax=Psittacicella melopsittaci TaxID=2028576 RepID=A0A3A1Y956_9GAMM|nr:hypothetical protein [Psittacicella melopsittaci]RIY33856.1 hypothetical protein CJP74_00725 [Psittacicella melopsittaci]
MRYFLLLCLTSLSFLVPQVKAEPLGIFGQGTTRLVFLGCLNCAPDQPLSVWQAYSKFGYMSYDPASVWNPNNRFTGNKSSFSLFNPTCSDNSPEIYGLQTTNYYGRACLDDPSSPYYKYLLLMHEMYKTFSEQGRDTYPQYQERIKQLFGLD